MTNKQVTWHSTHKITQNHSKFSFLLAHSSSLLPTFLTNRTYFPPEWTPSTARNSDYTPYSTYTPNPKNSTDSWSDRHTHSTTPASPQSYYQHSPQTSWPRPHTSSHTPRSPCRNWQSLCRHDCSGWSCSRILSSAWRGRWKIFGVRTGTAGGGFIRSFASPGPRVRREARSLTRSLYASLSWRGCSFDVIGSVFIGWQSFIYINLFIYEGWLVNWFIQVIQ